MPTTEEIVNEIKSRLRAEGVNVKVQQAVTTTSAYLVFDFGVLKRVRVHPGKAKYNYRFEIGDHIETTGAVERHFHDHTYNAYRYRGEDVARLVGDVLDMRADMIDRYGETGYQAIVDRNSKQQAAPQKKDRYVNGRWRRLRRTA